MTAIALCYLVTPLFYTLRKYSTVVLGILVLIGFVQYGFWEIRLFQFSWIYLYALGYFFVEASYRCKTIMLILSVLSFCIALCYIDFSILVQYNNPHNRFFHDVGGFILFFGGYYLIRKLPNSYPCKKVVQYLDNNSFYYYITHHVFIFGMFSMLHVTDIKLINVVFILFATLFTAYLLKQLSTFCSYTLSRFL